MLGWRRGGGLLGSRGRSRTDAARCVRFPSHGRRVTVTRPTNAQRTTHNAHGGLVYVQYVNKIFSAEDVDGVASFW